MGERDERRHREGGSYDYANDNDYLLEAINDVNAEIKEKLEALRELLQVEANLTMTPQKSNVTPVTVR